MAKIDITELFPYLNNGFVAMDGDGVWYWYKKRPHPCKSRDGWQPVDDSEFQRLSAAFNLSTDLHWSQTLQRVTK